MTMTTELAPLAHPERTRLTACLGCGLPLTDDTAHPTAVQCRTGLLAALATVKADRDDARSAFRTAWHAAGEAEREARRMQRECNALRDQLTQARSTLALVRSQVGTLAQTVEPGKGAR